MLICMCTVPLLWLEIVHKSIPACQSILKNSVLQPMWNRLAEGYRATLDMSDCALQGPAPATTSAWGKGNTVQRLSQQQQGQQQPAQSRPGYSSLSRPPSIPASQVSSS